MIVGSGGQLGRALVAATPADVRVVGHDRASLDITNAAAVEAAVAITAPDVLINAAAYTAVDKAEREEAVAFAINATAVGILAKAARAAGARFVHLSSDYVFDGLSSVPYAPDAVTAPLGAYGRTKLAGEQAAGDAALIVRTAWLYASQGSNFVRTMLQLMQSKSELRVVSDQVGAPTYAPGLATALWALVEQGAVGIHHYTDSGVASWYDFAIAIQEEARAAGLLASAVPVRPIAAVDFPTPARRPSYSVLDNSSTSAALGGAPPHWRVQLRRMIEEVRVHG